MMKVLGTLIFFTFIGLIAAIILIQVPDTMWVIGYTPIDHRTVFLGLWLINNVVLPVGLLFLLGITAYYFWEACCGLGEALCRKLYIVWSMPTSILINRWDCRKTHRGRELIKVAAYFEYESELQWYAKFRCHHCHKEWIEYTAPGRAKRLQGDLENELQ